MHLCPRHQAEWEATDEPTIAARMRTLSALPKHRQRRCINRDCRAKIGYPLFQLCVHCARRDRICQQCSRSTLTQEEVAAAASREKEEELFEATVDLFTYCVKTYGISASRALFMREAPCDPETLNRLLRLDLHDLDYGREKRRIWTDILGPNVWRKRRHDDCPEPHRATPSLCRASCGHLAAGDAVALCPLCAADASACETCGESV